MHILTLFIRDLIRGFLIQQATMPLYYVQMILVYFVSIVFMDLVVEWQSYAEIFSNRLRLLDLFRLLCNQIIIWP